MPAENLNELLSLIYAEAEKILGTMLKEVILYGSYARGDYDSESDVDVALIAESTREDLIKYHKRIAELISEVSLDYDILVSISCIPQNDFEQYKGVLPYYKNIDTEGVRLSA